MTRLVASLATNKSSFVMVDMAKYTEVNYFEYYVDNTSWWIHGLLLKPELNVHEPGHTERQ